MKVPALAVVGSDHQIIRSTETFRRKCEDPATLYKRAPELDLVLKGQTDTAVVDLGDFSVAIEAVTDAAGRRQAMLSLPGEDLAADPEAPLAALREAADASPAIVWVKDLDGRYLYVNERYERDLDTSEETLLGNTDADLPPVETVDGPRLRYIEDGLKEPLQLEYSVPEFESRPAMAALRFPLRDSNGQPVAICGVAAPTGESQIARDEAVRLMQLERWNRLDPLDVRAELLEQWHVQAKPGPIEEAEPDAVAEPDADPAAVEGAAPEEAVALVEPEAPEVVEEPLGPPEPARRQDDGAPYHREDEWVRQLRQAARIAADEAASETADALQSELQLARKWAERADQLQADLHEANARLREAEAEAQQSRARALEAEAEAQRAQTRAVEAEAEAKQAQARITEVEAGATQAIAAAQLAAEESSRLEPELEELRLELEREKADAQAARSEVEAARRELGAARAQAESLRGPADAALRLSEELGRALKVERERGDELARTLARIRSRLGDLEGALDRSRATKQAAA
jgi:PAS domain-containing protein